MLTWGGCDWCGRAGRDDIGVAIQHGDEPVRAGGVDVRAHGACCDADADREPVVLRFDGQHDTGEWVMRRGGGGAGSVVCVFGRFYTGKAGRDGASGRGC